MRKHLLAFGLLALAATPAAAQYVHPADEEMLRSLPDQDEIDAMGDAIGGATDALMDVDVGPLVDAVDPGAYHYRRHRPETLGDLATRNDPYARERIRRDIAAATAGVGLMVDRLAVLAPALRQSIEDSRRRMQEALRDSRFQRRYEPDRYDGYAPDRDWRDGGRPYSDWDED